MKSKVRRTKKLSASRPDDAILCELSVALIGACVLEDVLRIALSYSRRLVSFDKAAILLVDEATRELVTRASMGTTESESRWIGKVGAGITGLVAELGEPRYAPDVAKQWDYIRVEVGVRSELVVPLKVEGKTIGVLDVLSKKEDAFSKSDETKLCLIGAQAAAAINAKRKEEQQEFIAVASRIIANEPGAFDSRLKKIVQLVANRLRAGACSLFVEDSTRVKLVLSATTGLESHAGPFEYSPGEGITGWIYTHGRSLRIINLGDKDELKRLAPDLNWANKFSEVLDTHALRKQYMGVPLKTSGRCIGVLRVSEVVNRFETTVT